jgi:hypothetical protein
VKIVTNYSTAAVNKKKGVQTAEDFYIEVEPGRFRFVGGQGRGKKQSAVSSHPAEVQRPTHYWYVVCRIPALGRRVGTQVLELSCRSTVLLEY